MSAALTTIPSVNGRIREIAQRRSNAWIGPLRSWLQTLEYFVSGDDGEGEGAVLNKVVPSPRCRFRIPLAGPRTVYPCRAATWVGTSGIRTEHRKGQRGKKRGLDLVTAAVDGPVRQLVVGPEEGPPAPGAAVVEARGAGSACRRGRSGRRPRRGSGGGRPRRRGSWRPAWRGRRGRYRPIETRTNHDGFNSAKGVDRGL
jgi:hypothetical protein